MFRWDKPSVQMMGKFQPWHEDHRELFHKSVIKTGQVIIMVKEQNYSRVHAPWGFKEIRDMIETDLSLHGYRTDCHFIITQVPNIVNIICEEERITV